MLHTIQAYGYHIYTILIHSKWCVFINYICGMGEISLQVCSEMKRWLLNCSYIFRAVTINTFVQGAAPSGTTVACTGQDPPDPANPTECSVTFTTSDSEGTWKCAEGAKEDTIAITYISELYALYIYNLFLELPLFFLIRMILRLELIAYLTFQH